MNLGILKESRDMDDCKKVYTGTTAISLLNGERHEGLNGFLLLLAFIFPFSHKWLSRE